MKSWDLLNMHHSALIFFFLEHCVKHFSVSGGMKDGKLSSVIGES